MLSEFQHVDKVQHLKDGYSPDALYVLVSYLQNGCLGGYGVNKSVRSAGYRGVIVVNPSSTCKLPSLSSCRGNTPATCGVTCAGETP